MAKQQHRSITQSAYATDQGLVFAGLLSQIRTDDATPSASDELDDTP
ncbi:hypothetical protein N9026_00965 [bacterium]|nr:hypothetical protein [bacterium]